MKIISADKMIMRWGANREHVLKHSDSAFIRVGIAFTGTDRVFAQAFREFKQVFEEFKQVFEEFKQVFEEFKQVFEEFKQVFEEFKQVFEKIKRTEKVFTQSINVHEPAAMSFIRDNIFGLKKEVGFVRVRSLVNC